MNPFIRNESYKNSRNTRNGEYNRFLKPEVPNSFKPKEYIVQEHDFPDLNKQHTKLETEDITINSNSSFAKIASLQKIEDVKTDVLKSGWISLEMNKDNRDIEIKIGEKTPYMIKTEKMNKQDLDLDYQMYIAINQIEKNRASYEVNYDAINGEGKYEEVYKYYENSRNLAFIDSDNESVDENTEYEYDDYINDEY
jgi:hypothetical protein